MDGMPLGPLWGEDCDDDAASDPKTGGMETLGGDDETSTSTTDES